MHGGLRTMGPRAAFSCREAATDQPANSWATAVFAFTRSFPRLLNCSQTWCNRRFHAMALARVAESTSWNCFSGRGPAPRVLSVMLSGRFHQQVSDVGVPGLGGRTLASGATGGRLGGH